MSDQLEVPWEQIGQARARQRAGMVVDLHRCIGCHACSVACKTEHSIPLGGFRTRVRYLERPDRPTIAFLPLLCMQCQDAPCLDACPTEAIQRDDDGRVQIDKDRCCGNKACIAACPYQAIYIDQDTGLADKCDFCTHRTEVGLDPACAAACPTEALRFGDLDDAGDPVARYAEARGAEAFKEDAGTRPSVLFVGLEEWMEESAESGIQISPDDDDIVYEVR